MCKIVYLRPFIGEFDNCRESMRVSLCERLWSSVTEREESTKPDIVVSTVVRYADHMWYLAEVPN